MLRKWLSSFFISSTRSTILEKLNLRNLFYQLVYLNANISHPCGFVKTLQPLLVVIAWCKHISDLFFGGILNDYWGSGHFWEQDDTHPPQLQNRKAPSRWMSAKCPRGPFCHHRSPKETHYCNLILSYRGSHVFEGCQSCPQHWRSCRPACCSEARNPGILRDERF